MQSSRLDRSPVAVWWRTIDRWFLAAFLSLMGLGILLSFAASPAVAERIGLDSFHFATRQIVYMIPALAAMLAVSFLTPREVRRLAVVMLGGALLLMVAVLYIGVEVKGAHRWVSLFGVSVQPSEFMKPAFVIICAWLFAEKARNPHIPGNLLALLLLCLVVALLVLQPDLGQTILTISTWGVMFFMAGMPWFWIIGIGSLAVVGVFGAYVTFDHFAGRIDRFLTGEGDRYQVDMALDALLNGRWFGVGPGEGVYKKMIPDSHADFVFAVAGEEYGLIMCFLIMALFAFVVLRGLKTALREQDDFTRYAVSGLVAVFGFQSIINMGVNLQMMPAKGMTLPFISYGGSSLIAVAVSMGMVLALTRKKPEGRKRPGIAMMARHALPAE
ncbi:putative lipid II flippase FtsW [Kumtagia ephedrae]|uniref:Probable peptidoglycan glycosyltransferase FtsW n=1 Tax=Kumtagia ephedrae TaxID=2116701 RepID=A0A2P7SRJ1_9HYPH|nr:putative lipid II flippase FtsW [Mesorhizobium ephedrae]PSJ64955.1 putative lipid II flippase FtsW [Mesorhizobium ephedrae]